jgi:hypothetical protein
MCSPRRCVFPTGEYPPLPSHYSPQLSHLVAEMLQLDAAQRPSVAEASRRAQAMLAERVASKASRELTRGERRERPAAAEPPMAEAAAAGGSAVMGGAAGGSAAMGGAAGGSAVMGGAAGGSAVMGGAAGGKGASRGVDEEADAMPTNPTNPTKLVTASRGVDEEADATPRRLVRREADALLPQPPRSQQQQQHQHQQHQQHQHSPPADPATAALGDPTAPPSRATPRPAGVKRTDPAAVAIPTNPTNPTKLVTAAVAIPPPPPSHSEPSPAPSQLPTGVVPLACVPNIAAARAELPPSRGSDASAVSLREQRLQQRALERRRPSTSGSAGEGAGGGVFASGGGRELWMPATAPVTPQLTQSSTPPTSSTPPGVVPGVSLPEEHRDWSAAEVEAYVLAQQMQRLHARAGEAQQALLPSGAMSGAPMTALRPGSSTASSASGAVSGASRPTTAQSNRPPHLADTPAQTPQGDQYLRIRKERVARLLSPASAPLQPAAAGATRANGKDGGFAGRYDIISGDYRI